MLDRFCYKFFGAMDNALEWLANKISGPRCKCKKKKHPKRTYEKKKDHGTDISFENEINNGK